MRCRILVLMLLLSSKLMAQIAAVSDYDQSYIKNTTGNYILVFHESNFGHANKPISVYLMPGEYWLFCAEPFSFDENLEILKMEPSIANLKQRGKKAYSFSIEKEINLTIEVKTSVTQVKRSDHLFTFFLKYDPFKQQQLVASKYLDSGGKAFSTTATDKKYSVIFFWGRKDFLSSNLMEGFNQVANKYGESANFLCLTYEKREALQLFKEEYEFNWQMIPNISARELTKYEINGLISEPSIYIVDNAQSKIVFYYYGLYEIDKVLLSALSTLDQ